MICEKCGKENKDGLRFCCYCGARFPADIRCPICGADVSPDAGFCGGCGAKITRADVAVCPSCGEEFDAGVKFCGGCGRELTELDVTEKVTAAGRRAGSGAPVTVSMFAADLERGVKPQRAAGKAAAPRTRTGGGGIISRAAENEAGKRLIGNAFLAVVALVFALLALLVPVRVGAFRAEIAIVTDGYEKALAESGSAIEQTCGYINVAQSPFNFFGALPYMNMSSENADDVKRAEELGAKYRAAVEAAVRAAQGNVGSDALGNGYTEAFKKFYLDFERALNARLSDMNYIALELALDLPVYAYENTEDGYTITVTAGDPGAYTAASMAAVFGTISACIDIAVAAFAVVALVLALVGLAGKRSVLGARAFLRAMTIAAFVVFGLGFLSPFGAGGGNGMALLITACAARMIYGAAVGVVRGDGAISIAKGAAAPALILVATCLLSADIFTYTEVVRNAEGVATSTTHFARPVGGLINCGLGVTVPESFGIKQAENMMSIAASCFITAGFTAAAYALCAVALALELSAAEKGRGSAGLWLALASAVMMIVAAIMSGAESALGGAAPLYVAIAFAAVAFAGSLVEKLCAPQKQDN